MSNENYQICDGILKHHSPKRRPSSSAVDCRDYLTSLSLRFLGNHSSCSERTLRNCSHPYATFDVDSPTFVRRFRAAVQFVNRQFAEDVRRKGSKNILASKPQPIEDWESGTPTNSPQRLSHEEAIEWASSVLVRSCGEEPIGNYNPLILGELFWELFSKWELFATSHVDQGTIFTKTMLEETCPRDVQTRLTELKIKESLQKRRERAIEELDIILEDERGFPAVSINYYTDNVQKARMQRMQGPLKESIKAATQHEHLPGCNSNHTSASVDFAVAMNHFHSQVDRDMERYSCEEAPDCLFSMHKVRFKLFLRRAKLTG